LPLSLFIYLISIVIFWNIKYIFKWFLDLEFFESCESNGKESLVGLVEKTVKSNNTNSNIVKDTISINDTSNSSLVNNVTDHYKIRG